MTTRTEALREKIAKRCRDICCFMESLMWDDLDPADKDMFYSDADKILKDIKEAGMVMLAEDQSLPTIEFDEIKDTLCSLSCDDFTKVLAILDEWSKRIRRANFKKIKKEE